MGSLFGGSDKMNWVTPGVPKKLDPLAQIITPDKKKKTADQGAAPPPGVVYPGHPSATPQSSLIENEGRTILG